MLNYPKLTIRGWAEKSDLSHAAVQRGLAKLVKQKLVTNSGGIYELTEKGIALAKKSVSAQKSPDTENDEK
jgi:predicted transcriptional regulator